MKSAIFDMDGTLLDSVDYHAQAWQDAFRQFGHAFDKSSIRAQIGKGGDQLMPVFLDDAEIDRIGEDLEERRGEIFAATYLSKVRAFPGVRDLFLRLRDNGVQLALASSATTDELDRYKEIAGIADLVPFQTSSDDVERSKPFPDIFRAALDKLSSSPADTFAIGDTPYDAISAGGADLRAIGVLCGGWSESALRQSGCLEVYRDPADLHANLARSLLCRS